MAQALIPTHLFEGRDAALRALYYYFQLVSIRQAVRRSRM